MDEDTLRILRQMAKAQGIDDTVVNDFVVSQPIQPPQEQSRPSSSQLLGSPDTTMAQNTPKMPVEGERIQVPDYVTPMTGKDAVMTQGIGERPWYYGGLGHRGEDLAYNDGQTGITNPIGGVTFSGYDPYGFGNYSGIIGASPEELAQMSPEEKVRMAQQASEGVVGQADITGLSSVAPGKNISLQGHLAEPANLPPEIATGSAQLTEGSTGNSTAPHLHQEFMDTTGQLVPYSTLLQKELQKRVKK